MIKHKTMHCLLTNGHIVATSRKFSFNKKKKNQPSTKWDETNWSHKVAKDHSFHKCLTHIVNRILLVLKFFKELNMHAYEICMQATWWTTNLVVQIHTILLYCCITRRQYFNYSSHIRKTWRSTLYGQRTSLPNLSAKCTWHPCKHWQETLEQLEISVSTQFYTSYNCQLD